MDGHSEIADVLRRLSAAWRERRYDELAALFDERVVMALPGLAGRVEGREALVASYREFMERATLDEYREGAPTIDVWSETAIAVYRWEMVWTSDGKTERGSGYEVFAFTHRAGGTPPWRAVWRTITFDAG